MKFMFLFAAAAGLAAFSGYAQMHDNQEKQMTCRGDDGGEHARYCDIREQSFPGVGHITIDGRQNGGAAVKGWLRNEVLVRAKVESWAETAAEARSLASQVHVQTAGGDIHADGPEMHDAGWSVSYEVFVPQTTDLSLKTHNGGISISDVRGRMEFHAVNGGVHLKRIAGDVNGETVNGGVQVEFAGNSWEGRQLEVRTSNGGVTLSVPEQYSARIETSTVNGSVRTDFPVPVQTERTHELQLSLGSGGPLVRVTTVNGSVRLKRIS